MISDIRDVLPVLLIPSAWILSYFILNGSLESDPMRIAHIVMFFFITIFLITGYKEMDSGVLKAWLIVLVIGWVITILGITGFYYSDYSDVLHKISLFGWMIAPALGLVYTGYKSGYITYYVSSSISFIGLVSAFIISPSVGVVVVAVGQTVGMCRAVWDSKYDLEEGSDGHEGI